MSKYEIDEETGEVLLSHSVISAEDVVDRLNDLEAKLAESDDCADRYWKQLGILEEENKQLKRKLTENIVLLEGLRKFEEEKKDIAMKRVYVLKQQLAEKEKERELDNAFWKQECDSLQKALDESENKIDKLEDKLHHYYEETLNKGTCGLCEHLRGEYKTDFAIEQLVSVQKYISDNAVYLEEESFGREINDYIDQQIALLREKK